jgi:hypothetical protein
MTQHKWHKEIKAWADGAEIEVKNQNDTNKWELIIKNPMWYTDDWWEYRIKPQPKEPQYLYVFCDGIGNQLLRTHIGKNSHETYIGKIKLEVDDD